MKKTIFTTFVLSGAIFAYGFHSGFEKNSNYSYHSQKSKYYAKSHKKSFKKSHKKRFFHHQAGLKSGGAFNLDNYPKTENLPQNVKDTLAYMGNEERLAYDVYMNLYNYYQKNYNIKIRQLYNISQRSESRHIKTVQALVKRYNLNASDFTNIDKDVIKSNNMSPTNMPSGVYGIPKIQELYDTLYAMGQESKEDALKVGCMVEVTDINDLNEYIKEAQEANAKDIVEAYKFLRNGSYNHYWAFDRGLKSMGVSDGCCSLGDEYCHLEYPKK